jgi:hypothetical protein
MDVFVIFTKIPGEWLRIPKVFDQALVAIVHALMWFRPAGGHNDPLFFYSSVVEGLISDIRAADPSLF